MQQQQTAQPTLQLPQAVVQQILLAAANQLQATAPPGVNVGLSATATMSVGGAFQMPTLQVQLQPTQQQQQQQLASEELSGAACVQANGAGAGAGSASEIKLIISPSLLGSPRASHTSQQSLAATGTGNNSLTLSASEPDLFAADAAAIRSTRTSGSVSGRQGRRCGSARRGRRVRSCGAHSQAAAAATAMAEGEAEAADTISSVIDDVLAQCEEGEESSPSDSEDRSSAAAAPYLGLGQNVALKNALPRPRYRRRARNPPQMGIATRLTRDESDSRSAAPMSGAAAALRVSSEAQLARSAALEGVPTVSLAVAGAKPPTAPPALHNEPRVASKQLESAINTPQVDCAALSTAPPSRSQRAAQRSRGRPRQGKQTDTIESRAPTAPASADNISTRRARAPRKPRASKSKSKRHLSPAPTEDILAKAAAVLEDSFEGTSELELLPTDPSAMAFEQQTQSAYLLQAVVPTASSAWPTANPLLLPDQQYVSTCDQTPFTLTLPPAASGAPSTQLPPLVAQPSLSAAPSASTPAALHMPPTLSTAFEPKRPLFSPISPALPSSRTSSDAHHSPSALPASAVSSAAHPPAAAAQAPLSRASVSSCSSSPAMMPSPISSAGAGARASAWASTSAPIDAQPGAAGSTSATIASASLPFAHYASMPSFADLAQMIAPSAKSPPSGGGGGGETPSAASPSAAASASASAPAPSFSACFYYSLLSIIPILHASKRWK